MSNPFKIRRDTISKQKEDRAVDESRQQIVFCLAVRGEGKSTLIEVLGEKQFRRGYTLLDLHAPPNFENAFWCIPRFPDTDKDGKHDQTLFEMEMKKFRDAPSEYMKNHESYPITILCSESFQWQQDSLDRFNDRMYNQDEFYEDNKDNPDRHFDLIYPQMKPRNRWGKEMIRFVKIPNLKRSQDADENIKAYEIIRDTILDCRKQRRIFVLNRQAFGNENQYFWTMELIMRKLADICEEHFIRLFPYDVGVKTEKEMTQFQRKWHRLTVIHRELSDLAPAKLKADKGGESTTVKKALLGFARLCRHWEIDWFADWQHQNSCEGSIRQQCDTWLYKKYNRSLGGDDAKVFFDKITWLRKRILMKGNNSPRTKIIADSWFPKVEELSKKYFYAKFLSDNIKLFRVPENRHQHKEPYMKLQHLTGIRMWHDIEKIPKTSGGDNRKNQLNDQKLIYETIKSMKLEGLEKKWKMDDICKKMGVLQDRGEIKFTQNFAEKDGDYLGAVYSRLKKKFKKIE